MLMRRHSTKKLSARFPREMPACAKRARFRRATKIQHIRAYGQDSSAGVAKDVCRAQRAVSLRTQGERQMRRQNQGAPVKRGRYEFNGDGQFGVRVSSFNFSTR